MVASDRRIAVEAIWRAPQSDMSPLPSTGLPALNSRIQFDQKVHPPAPPTRNRGRNRLVPAGRGRDSQLRHSRQAGVYYVLLVDPLINQLATALPLSRMEPPTISMATKVSPKASI
jgi:hypothetical protein